MAKQHYNKVPPVVPDDFDRLEAELQRELKARPGWYEDEIKGSYPSEPVVCLPPSLRTGKGRPRGRPRKIVNVTEAVTKVVDKTVALE